MDDPGKLESIVNSLETLAKQTGMPVVVSTHPRTKLRLDRLGVGASDSLRFYEPFGYLDYNKLQLEARVVLSDSGSIAEESYAMGLRSVSIRDSIERPEAIESATILLGGTGLDDILQNFELADQRRGFKPELSDYEIGDFSTRVISILFSTVNKVPFWKNTQAGH